MPIKSVLDYKWNTTMHGISYAAIIYHNNKLGMNHETITRLTNTKPNKPIVYTSKKKIN
jgi:ABC-type thiamine transport system substrate-binding protein